MSLKTNGCVYYLNVSYEKDTEPKYNYNTIYRKYEKSPNGIYIKEGNSFKYDSREKYK